MNQNLTVALLCVLLLTNCKQPIKKETPAENPGQIARLPLPPVDVPFDEYTVDAAKGDTLVYKTGSVILFPPNAFVDKEGKLVTGNVVVKYREFADPLDIYLAGVNMNYNSAGISYTFESMAMCEVLAFQNGVPVFVNQKSKPGINLVARNNSTTNFYYYDSVKQNWVFKGNAFTATMAELREPEKKPSRLVRTEKARPSELMIPQKADGSGPFIRVFIEAGSFPELMPYDNIKFQLDTAVQKFSAADSEEEWNDIKLERGKDRGTYVVHLSNTSRSVKYIGRPVFEGQEYDAAMKVFNEKLAASNRAREERLLAENKNREESLRAFVKDSLENEKIIRQNEKIGEKNKQIQAQNEKTVRDNERATEMTRRLDSLENDKILRLQALMKVREKEIAEMKVLAEQQTAGMKLAMEEKARLLREADLAETAIMAFPIDNFGVWNIDKQFLGGVIPMYAVFIDNKGNELPLKRIAVFTKRFNTVIRYTDNNIKLVEAVDNIIVGVHNNQLAYFTFKNFNRFKIGADLGRQELTMTLVEENKTDYAHLRALFKR